MGVVVVIVIAMLKSKEERKEKHGQEATVKMNVFFFKGPFLHLVTCL